MAAARNATLTIYLWIFQFITTQVSIVVSFSVLPHVPPYSGPPFVSRQSPWGQGAVGQHWIKNKKTKKKQNEGWCRYRCRCRCRCANGKLRTMLYSWKSHQSTEPDADAALQELLSSIGTGSDTPDVAFLFMTSKHAGSFSRIVKDAAKQLPPKTQFIALVGGGTIGQGNEIDQSNLPAMSMLSGCLVQGAKVEMYSFNELTNPPPKQSAFWKTLQQQQPESNHDNRDNNNNKKKKKNQMTNVPRKPSFLLFVDPWSSFDVILEGLRGSVVAGGISVPAQASFQPTVAMNGKPLPQGSAVILRWTGTMGLQAIVSQGCRPVGSIYTVTKTLGNVLQQLDGVPALQQLQKTVNEASEGDRKIMSSAGYLVGIASANSVEQGTLANTEFLIRQIIGFQPDKGAVVVGTRDIQVGDRIRFHLRDAQAARDDMKLQMQRARSERLFAAGGSAPDSCGQPVAAIQISCVARGQAMFSSPNVDLSHISTMLLGATNCTNDNDNDHHESIPPPQPVAGFFANGEIGPVGIAGFQPEEVLEGTFLHGFTTVVALLCDFSPKTSPPSSPSDMAGHQSVPLSSQSQSAPPASNVIGSNERNNGTNSSSATIDPWQ